jgi:hypothetical protein
MLFDRVLQEGGIWHLLGHSWETEKLGDWSQLREMLDYVSGKPRVRYLTNTGACDLAHTPTTSGPASA